jgi:uncharacterized protein HemX
MTPPQQSPGQRDSDEQPDRDDSGNVQSSDGHPTSADADNPQGAEEPAAEKPKGSDAISAPKKRKTGLIVGIAAALVVLAVGAGVGFVFLGSGSAQSAAEDYASLSTKETQDPRSVTAEDYRPIVCSQAMPQIEQLQQQKEEFLKAAKPEDLEQLKQVRVSVAGVQENGDSGSATIQSTMPGQQPQSTDLKLVKEDGDWKLCA